MDKYGHELDPAHAHSIDVTVVASFIVLALIVHGPDVVKAAKSYCDLVFKSTSRIQEAADGSLHIDNAELRENFNLSAEDGDDRHGNPLLRNITAEVITVSPNRRIRNAILPSFARLTSPCYSPMLPNSNTAGSLHDACLPQGKSPPYHFHHRCPTVVAAMLSITHLLTRHVTKHALYIHPV